MEKKKLPKKLFMAWNTDGNEPFLDHSENASELAEQDRTVEVGLYELIKMVKLHNKTTIK